MIQFNSRNLEDYGGVAQLARAPALQAGGHRFEPDHLHHTLNFDILYRDVAQLVRAPP